jgi:conjugal transfer mating pair stabilization protein TraG
MNYVITTYGGGELFFLVFNGIAALFNQENGGIIGPLVHLGLLVGSAYVVVLMLFQNQLIEGVRWLLWVIVVTNLLFLPKTRIHIYDPLNNTHRDVDHVPLALGAFASLTSQIGQNITENLEAVFTLPDYLPYHKTGTVFASSLMSQLGKFRIVDPTFKGNMERFVNGCVVYDAMIGHKYSLQDLHNSPNIWELVMTHASPVLGFLYKEESAPGTIITCREGSTKLNALWSSEIKKATALYGTRVQVRDLNEAAFNTELLGSARLLMGATAWADSAQNLLRQEMMIHAIEEGSHNKLSELGSASTYAATKALLQQRSAYAVAGEIAARTLPLFKNVIEALSYALFIFIVVLALMPNGHRVLVTYAGILVWTQLWAPLYAVLNLIMSLYGRSETMAHSVQQGLTLLNSSAIINANADMTTLAAWLSVSIPFISYGILRQGAAAFVGLAQHLGSAMQAAASSAAAETVSGNISLGNVTMGTQAYQNTSAFQHSTSPGYSDAEFKAMSASGIEQATFASGVQSLSDHGLSLTPVTLMASVNASQEAQQRLHDAQSLANSTSVAAGKSLETAIQQTTNLLERVGSDSFSHDTLSQTISSSETKALQDHHHFVRDISENLNVSKAVASDLAVHIKAGSPEKWLTSVDANVNLSSTMTNQEGLQRAQSIAEQKGYTYSIDSAVSAAKTLMEGTNDTQGIELAKATNASLNSAHHLREEATLAHTHAKELSSSFASSQRKDFQESRNITQDFLEFVSHQPVNMGPNDSSPVQEIGMMGALSILKGGGSEYDNYLHHFMQDHPQYTLQRVNTSQERATIDDRYTHHSANLKEKNSFSEDYQERVLHLDNEGLSQGLPGPSPESDLPEKVENRLNSSTVKLKHRREDEISYAAKQSQAIETSSQENVALGNVEHAGKKILGTAGKIANTLNPFQSSEAKASSNTQPFPQDPIRSQEPED